MMMFRRVVVIALSIAMLSASIPSPALALSTAGEVELGKQYDKQITDSQAIVTDPLLNAWVNDVAQKIWAQTARKDVPYSIKIIDEPDINAFSTLGGFVYINEGTLDFAQSDDELASVIGHETGHIERRHAVTANNKASILNVLFGIGSMFSPFLYRFGQLLEAGAMAKISRQDETQADQYGLMLMSRAGYDPEAMVSFMKHLGVVSGEERGLFSKYLADHPGVPNRIAHLEGYPELDPTKRTDDQRLAAAIHDLDTARYSIAAMQLGAFERTHGDDATVQFDLGQAQLALGEDAQGAQNIAASAQRLSGHAKTLADMRIKALRDAKTHLDLLHPNLQPLRDRVTAAQSALTRDASAIETRRAQGLTQLKALNNREDQVVYGIPDLSQVQPRKGSRLDTVVHDVAQMSRSLNTATSKASEVIDGVGSLQRGKEGGLLGENAAILTEMAAPLASGAPSSQALSVFPAYPRMLDEMTTTDADIERSVDAARASLALLDVGLGDLQNFVNDLRHSALDGTGDIALSDYTTLQTSMGKAVASLARAATGSTQASQLYNMARSRQLVVRIDMLGLAESPDRYATLQHALDLRFHATGVDYADLVRGDLTPGDIAAAVIIGADTNAAAPAVLAQATARHETLVDVANERGMFAQSLEIFLGLIYLDYTDDPAKEVGAPVTQGHWTG